MSDADHIARVRTVFDAWADHGRAEGMADSHIPFARRVFAQLPLRHDTWYLDVGCGTGYTVRWAARASPNGRAVGLDVSPAMLALARRLSVPYPTVEYHLAAFPTHPLPPGRFDVIFSMEVLYYLPEPCTGMAAIRRLLKPGGVVACAVDYYAENPASHDWPTDVGVPMTLWDRGQWSRAFEEADLEVTEQRQVTLPPDEASEAWKVTTGSLVTVGRRRAS